MATGWSRTDDTFTAKVAHFVVRFLPASNPDYKDLLPSINEWLVEFTKDGLPCREIGLNSNGDPILCGPDKRNYGYWLDTNMKENNFVGESIAESEFERLWLLGKNENSY